MRAWLRVRAEPRRNERDHLPSSVSEADGCEETAQGRRAKNEPRLPNGPRNEEVGDERPGVGPWRDIKRRRRRAVEIRLLCARRCKDRATADQTP